MVINIRLSDRTSADNDDPLGRAWYGYDPEATPEQLWQNNRGDYFLDAERIAEHRWAALNYHGRVVVVAELTGPRHEIVMTRTGREKKALLGSVMAATHPIHQALAKSGAEYPPGTRNSIRYSPDPDTIHPLDAALPELGDEPGAPGQGLQMNPQIRKAIEDAAQDRLMQHYRDDGWTVTDTRHNRPYDAEAVKGDKRVYLEAKGTQSRGETVIVTPNEVEHARLHPGLCVIGVWSGMRLTPGGAVDPDAGLFNIIGFDPDKGDLRPRGFDWALPPRK